MGHIDNLWEERKRMLARGYGFCRSVTSAGRKIFNWHPLRIKREGGLIVDNCTVAGWDFHNGEKLPFHRWIGQDQADHNISLERNKSAQKSQSGSNGGLGF